MTDETPTLEQVYAQYNVTGEQRQPAQSVEQQQATSPEPPQSPADGAALLAGELAALRDEVGGLRDENTRMQQDAARRQEQADLKDVLGKLGEKLEGVKSKHIKYALAERYEEDAKFKELWDRRADNPEAFQAALDALTPVLQDELAVKADPKIAQDQAAFDNALQGADQTRQDAADDETHRLMKLSHAEFEQEWRRLING